MMNFSKFLNDKEELKYVIRLKNQAYKSYFTIFLLLLAFFMLFPMWRAGRAGIVIWLFVVMLLIWTLARQLMSKNNVYLLTSRRLIFLKAINKDLYNIKGSLQLKNIEEISKHNFNNICLLVSERKFYLLGVQNRDKVIQKIKTIIKV